MSWLSSDLPSKVRRSLRGAPSRAARRRSLAVRPKLETLEDRTLLSGNWLPLDNQMPNGDGASTMMLLTDGSVIVQGGAGVASSAWYRLHPAPYATSTDTGFIDPTYIQGQWSNTGSMTDTNRRFFASDVLPNGQVLVAGGEYISGDPGLPSSFQEINEAEIYDPGSGSWSKTQSVPTPDNHLGDAPSEVLPDGHVLVGYMGGPQTYIYDPSAGTWSSNSPSLLTGNSGEATWVKLPGGTILAYQNVFGGEQAERFIPGPSDAQGQWVLDGQAPGTLGSRGGSSDAPEQGPAFLLPNGKVFFIGASGNTALYTPPANPNDPTAVGTWTEGPTIKDNSGNLLGAFDTPGAMMPNGDVLFAAGPIDGINYSGPTTIFEYDPTSGPVGTIVQVSGLSSTPKNLNDQLSNDHPYLCSMVALPTAQVLFSDNTGQLWVYTPTEAPLESWKPTITDIHNVAFSDPSGKEVDNLTLTGTQLNGLSEGAAYGDDEQMASNFPLVRFIEPLGDYFSTTTGWVSAVQTGDKLVSTNFTPAPTGACLLTVSANGIVSDTALYILADLFHTDNITLQLAGNNSATLQILSDGQDIGDYIDFGTFDSIIIAGAGTTSLTLDYTNGDFTPAGGIIYDGGTWLDNGPNVQSTLHIIAPAGSTTTWNITGTNSGTVTSSSIAHGTITFSNVYIIEGSAANDKYVFGPNGKLSNGILGDNAFAVGTGWIGGADSLDVSALFQPTVTLGIHELEFGTSNNPTTLYFGGAIERNGVAISGYTGISSILGNPTSPSTLTSTDDDNVSWLITSGTNGFTDETWGSTILFSNFSALVGGAGDDDFGIASLPTASLSLDGGGGSNNSLGRLDQSQIDVLSYPGIGPITASGQSGAITVSFWVLTSAGGGSLYFERVLPLSFLTVPNIESFPGTPNPDVSFSSIQDPRGSILTDVFSFRPGGSVTGTIDGGGGGDWLDYSGVPGPISFDLANGTASLTGGVQNIQYVLVLDAGGKPQLTIDDFQNSSSGPTTYTITPTSIQTNSDLPIGLAGLGSLILEGRAGSTYNVEGTAAGTTVTIDTTELGNKINVAPSAKDLDQIMGTLNIHADTPTGTSLVLNDEQHKTGDSFVITSAGIVYGDPLTINYTGIGSIVLNGGASETYTVEGTPPGGLTLNAGSNDTVNIGDATTNLDGIGVVTVNGSVGTVLAIHDEATQDTQEIKNIGGNNVAETIQNAPVFQVGASSIARVNTVTVAIGSAVHTMKYTTTINYQNVPRIALYGGASPNIFDVYDTATPTSIDGGSSSNDSVVVTSAADYASQLVLTGFEHGSVNVPGNFTGSLSDTSPGHLETVNIGESLTASGTLSAGSIDNLTVGGNLSGSLILSGTIGNLNLVNGGLAPTASLTLGSLASLVIGPDHLVVGQNLAGRLTVIGNLGSVRVAGGTPGSIVAGHVGTIEAFGGYGPVVLRVTENGVERRVEEATPGNPYPQPDPTSLAASPNNPNYVNIQYVYGSGTPASPGSLANPQLTARITNNLGTAPDQYDLGLVAYSDTAKFNLARLDAAGVAGVRNVAVEGDLLSSVSPTAASFFQLSGGATDAAPAGIRLGADALAAVGVRDYAPNSIIQAKSIQALGFGAYTRKDGQVESGAEANGRDAANLLVPGTTIVAASDATGVASTYRVPFSDVQQARQSGLFIVSQKSGGQFDDDSLVLTDQGVPQDPTNPNSATLANPRGSVTALVTMVPTFDKHGNPQNPVVASIALRGDGGSIQTGQAISGSITSSGPLGDLQLAQSNAALNVTAPSAFGSIELGGQFAGTIQTTGVRTDPITGAPSTIPASLGRTYYETSSKGSVLATTVVHSEGTMTGWLISRGDLISQVIIDGGVSGGMAIQGNIDGTIASDKDGHKVHLGGLVFNGGLQGQLVVLGNVTGDMTIHGGLQGGRIAIKGSVGQTPGLAGTLEIDGSIDQKGALVVAGAVGNTAAGTTLTLNGSVQGILATGGPVTFSKTPDSSHAAFFATSLSANDSTSLAAVDAIFTQGGQELSFDVNGLDGAGLALILQDLGALHTGANHKLTGPVA